VVTIENGSRHLINPGSVGQPRDGDSRAAYAIADLDQKVVTLYRVAYPIEVAQKKILDAGLPPMLAYRLGMGR
jgi:diadenosine tetraphosphatase ApaH/serine/threonine PP2A family protein phosphatase